jgi:hypothetical protein
VSEEAAPVRGGHSRIEEPIEAELGKEVIEDGQRSEAADL